MLSRPKGLVLIINNVIFANKQKHKDRIGSNEDKTRLRNTFGFIGFEVLSVAENVASKVKEIMPS